MNKNSVKQNSLLFILGCLISFFSFILILLIEYPLENFIVNELITLTTFFKGMFYCLFVALVEEFIFRYLFLKDWLRNKHKPFNKNVIYLGLLSSLIFGFLHLNLDAFPLLQINLTLSGISMFYATYKFRRINIAIGMHFFWNFIQGGIFPFEGSGSELESVFIVRNGAMMYPEASNFMVFAFLLEILLIKFLSNSISFNQTLIPLNNKKS